MSKPVIRIHPAIGFARVGNSLDGFFVGPEIPDRHPSIRIYRDKDGSLKRQAARFRLFAYDGSRSREITVDDVTSILWTVHLRNSKAAARRCSGILHTNSTLRNARFENRTQLIFDRGPQCISGVSSRVDIVCPTFMGRKFRKPLSLGTLRTDSKGHLLVLGGYGLSGSLTGAGLTEKNGNDFANHDGWYDDTSDGSVQAVVTLKDGSKVTAVPSWVIVAPPKYAPALQTITTLYDTLYQVAIDRGLKRDPFSEDGPDTFRPSFRHDIYPILRRAAEMRWVFSKMAVAHEHQFSVKQCRTDRGYSKHVFRQFRTPSDSAKRPGSGTGVMPYIWSDLFPLPINGTVTRHQYNILKAWSEGRFEDDWDDKPLREALLTPAGMDRAALQACVGAAFYPGIECSFHTRDKFRYLEAFRLDPRSLKPGDVTAQMSIPWQSDFVDCSDEDVPFVWWPAQRPIDVALPNQERRNPYPTVRWARNFSGGKRDLSASEMVRDWHRLGLIGRYNGRLVETKRINKNPR